VKAVEERALTIAEFCDVENLSRATYYKLKRLGYGPEETRILVAGVVLIRIAPAARLDWHKKLAALRDSEAGALEFARRQAQAVVAGKLAAASPAHVSRRTTVAARPPPRRRKAATAR
jgi:hypothetical protein